MIQQLLYWWRRSKNPELADYLSEGLGIYCRSRRARRYWAAHLALCKRFQAEAVASLHPEARRCTVLGAGRLLDLETAHLLLPGRETTLVDADPGAVASWRGFTVAAKRGGALVSPGHREITGRILGWTAELERLMASGAALTSEALAETLWKLPALPKAPVALSAADVVCSLNILSQIPIHWRERVLGLIRRFSPRLFLEDERLPEPLETAIERTMSLLQIEHLELLRQIGARLTILISDTEFYFYKQDTARWQVDKALYDCPAGSLLPGTVRMRDTWLWHIAPQGVEQPDYGAIHKVEAFASVLE